VPPTNFLYLVDALEATGLDHGRGAAGPFFGWLEQQPHARALGQAVPRLHEQRGRGHERRHVAVVAAHVRGVIGVRPVWQAFVSLGHAQGVHVGAQGDAAGPRAPVGHRWRGRAGAFNVNDEPGTGEHCAALEADFLKGLADPPERADLLKSGLWVPVEVVTERRCARQDRRNGRLERRKCLAAHGAAWLRSWPAPAVRLVNDVIGLSNLPAPVAWPLRKPRLHVHGKAHHGSPRQTCRGLALVGVTSCV